MSKQFMERCIYFSRRGIMDDCCKQGIKYDLVRVEMDRSKPFEGLPVHYPCTDTDIANCPSREYPTIEDQREYEFDMELLDIMLEFNISSCCQAEVILDHLITEGPHKGHGPAFCSDCKVMVWRA